MENEFFVDSFIGHLSNVKDFCFTPDCKYLISGSQKGKIIIWEIGSGNIIKEFQAHTNSAVLSLDISKNGKYLISGSSDHTARIWSFPAGDQIMILDWYRNSVMNVLVSPDDKFILTQMESIIKIWDLSSGKFIRDLEGDIDNNSKIIISPDGKSVVGTSRENIIIWDFDTGKVNKTIRMEQNYNIVGKTLLFTPLGKNIVLVVGQGADIILILELNSERILKQIKTKGGIKNLSISPDGKFLLGLAGSRLVYLWNFDSGQLIREIKFLEGEDIELLKFSPDEKFIVGGFRNGKIKLWAFLEGKSFNYETFLKVKEEIAKRKESKIEEPVEKAIELKEENIQATEPEIPMDKSGDILAFISYSTKDAQIFRIKYIAEKLTSYPEIKDALYWQEDMNDNIIKYMSDNLGYCHIFILFCSPNALTSKPIEKEWTAADIMEKPIIPVFLNPDHIPNLLKSRLGLQIDIFDLDKTVSELHELILKKLRPDNSNSDALEKLTTQDLNLKQKKRELEDIVNNYYIVIFGFFDDLFSEKSVGAIGLQDIIQYVDDNSKELDKYFGFHRELKLKEQQQTFYFLKSKYRIDFKTNLHCIIAYPKDSNPKKISMSQPKEAKLLYEKMLEEIKHYLRNSFNIQIKNEK